MIKKCSVCKKDFRTYLCCIKNGQGKYCSHKCYSIALKGRKLSKETIQKILKSKKGYKHSEETKRKISESNKGKKISLKQRRYISSISKGKHYSPSTEFKKGNPAPKTAFKKGMIPWIKGRKMPRGKLAFRWKGGKTMDNGYVFIYSPNHPFTNNKKYVKRSRLRIEAYLKRYLTPEEVVHHKGTKYPISSMDNRKDDRLENLQLFANSSTHIKFHSILKKQKLIRLL